MIFDRLLTEQANQGTKNIDMQTTAEIVTAIHREDETVATAVRIVLPQIAQAVDLIVAAMQKGGRLFYIGAGTSGRLGVLDAAECPPTFSTQPELVQAIIAGGEKAMFQAIEGAEDSLTQAETDLRQRGLGVNDVVVGLAASGRTPYVIGGLAYANRLGCHTMAIVCVPDSEVAKTAQLTIAVLVGPEVIAGSTRMKAGTAQKMVLNMLSTATMIKLGKTYGNLMVDVRATNAKLTARVHRMVREVTGATEQETADALALAAGSAKIAIVMLLGQVNAGRAMQLIEQARGSVRQALTYTERTRKPKKGDCGHDE